MKNVMTDNEIVELYLARREEASEYASQKYAAKLHRMASTLLSDKRDAEECVNDTFLKAWGSIPPNKPDDLYLFLARICRYTAIDIIRKNNTSKRDGMVVELTHEIEECIPDTLRTAEFSDKTLKTLINEFLGSVSRDKRMILIIDELDRCNPCFATKILEVIKHFYNLSNITIIIVSNNNELQNTIKQQFGQNFDSYTYLNRFFDYTITIDNKRSLEYSKKFLKFKNETYLPHDVYYAMAQKYRFSLRDCNRYRILYDMAIEYIENTEKRNFFFNKKENYCIYSIILPIIYAFKIKDVNAYSECINGRTKKLEDALYYLNDYFNKVGHGRWLLEFVDINKKIEEINDDEVIKEIIDVFDKVYNSNGIDKVFLKAIKVNL